MTITELSKFALATYGNVTQIRIFLLPKAAKLSRPCTVIHFHKQNFAFTSLQNLYSLVAFGQKLFLFSLTTSHQAT
jgi:hypothetical protein